LNNTIEKLKDVTKLYNIKIENVHYIHSAWGLKCFKEPHTIITTLTKFKNSDINKDYYYLIQNNKTNVLSKIKHLQIIKDENITYINNSKIQLIGIRNDIKKHFYTDFLLSNILLNNTNEKNFFNDIEKENKLTLKDQIKNDIYKWNNYYNKTLNHFNEYELNMYVLSYCKWINPIFFEKIFLIDVEKYNENIIIKIID
jgi:hypothetical protein